MGFRKVERCKNKNCKIILLTEDELDCGYCEDCLEVMAERSQERREWDYYHND